MFGLLRQIKDSMDTLSYEDYRLYRLAVISGLLLVLVASICSYMDTIICIVWMTSGAYCINKKYIYDYVICSCFSTFVQCAIFLSFRVFF